MLRFWLTTNTNLISDRGYIKGSQHGTDMPLRGCVIDSTSPLTGETNMADDSFLMRSNGLILNTSRGEG